VTLVSVVIPAFNAEGFVLDSIISALASDGCDVEVIVVDDCSTDGTAAIVEQVDDARVRLFRQPKRRGAPAARNLGLANARGEFVQFLDSDDVLSPEKIQLSLEEIKRRLDLDVVFTEAFIFSEDGSITYGSKYPEMDDHPVEYLLHRLFQTACGLHRREKVVQLGGFREDLKRGQEFELHLRMALSGARMTLLQQRLVGLRSHQSAHRITNTPIAPDHHGDLMCRLGEFALAQQALHADEKLAFAQSLMGAGMSCFRKGTSAMGQQCIEMAIRLAPSVPYPHMNPVIKGLGRVVGPVRMEQTLRATRALSVRRQ
jgi:hypothetical protein